MAPFPFVAGHSVGRVARRACTGVDRAAEKRDPRTKRSASPLQVSVVVAAKLVEARLEHLLQPRLDASRSAQRDSGASRRGEERADVAAAAAAAAAAVVGPAPTPAAAAGPVSANSAAAATTDGTEAAASGTAAASAKAGRRGRVR